MDNFSLLLKIGEGAHGIVWKAKNILTKEFVALKKIPLKSLNDGIPINTLREIKTLQQLDHDNVVKLFETFPDGPGFVLVFEYLISDLSAMLKSDISLSNSVVKRYMTMLLNGVDYFHQMDIIHRDLKPANLLISDKGIIKIADFGLARIYSDESRVYSHQVVTRWYRSPELLYGSKNYDKGIDLWAIGCIFGELLNISPIFPGESDIEQLCLVLKTLGTPSSETWPGMENLPDYNKIIFPECKAVPFEEIFPDVTADAIDLIKSFLIYSSAQRISAEQALCHKYFFTHPLPCNMEELPIPHIKTYENSTFNELDCLKPIEESVVNVNHMKRLR